MRQRMSAHCEMPMPSVVIYAKKDVHILTSAKFREVTVYMTQSAIEKNLKSLF